MNKIKKIILFIILVVLACLCVGVKEVNAETENTVNFAKWVEEDKNRNLNTGNFAEWVSENRNSFFSATDLLGKTFNAGKDSSNVSDIKHNSAVCLYHQASNDYSQNKKVEVKVVDVLDLGKNSNGTYIKENNVTSYFTGDKANAINELAYALYQRYDSKDTESESSKANAIKYIWHNVFKPEFENYINTSYYSATLNKADSNNYVDYANSYAQNVINYRDITKGNTTPEVKIKDGKTYIGPLKINYTSGSQISFDVNIDETKYTNFEYFKYENDKYITIKEIENDKDFYIGIGISDKISVNKKCEVSVKQTMNYYKARIALLNNNYYAADDNKGQHIMVFAAGEEPIESSAKWVISPKKGSLTIYKKDGEGAFAKTLEGAKVKIKDQNEKYLQNSDNECVWTISKNGLNIDDIEPGKYKIIEVEAPTGYDLSLQDNKDNEKEIIIIEGKNTICNLNNIQYGTLKILKVESYSNEYLSGIKFRIYKMNGGNKEYIKGYVQDDNKNKKIAEIEFSAKKEESYEFTTDKNGEITLKNIPLGTYYVDEIVDETKYKVTSENFQKIEVKTNKVVSKDRFYNIIYNLMVKDKRNINNLYYVATGMKFEDLADEKKSVLRDSYNSATDKVGWAFDQSEIGDQGDRVHLKPVIERVLQIRKDDKNYSPKEATIMYYYYSASGFGTLLFKNEAVSNIKIVKQGEGDNKLSNVSMRMRRTYKENDVTQNEAIAFYFKIGDEKYRANKIYVENNVLIVEATDKKVIKFPNIKDMIINCQSNEYPIWEVDNGECKSKDIIFLVQKPADALVTINGNGYGTELLTDGNGQVLIKNISVYGSSKYSYEVVECSNNNYGYKNNINMVKSSSLEAGKEVEFKITNKLYLGNLKIEKVDASNYEIKLNGVDFKIRNESGYIALEDEDGKIIEKIIGNARVSRTNKAYMDTKENKMYYKLRYVKEKENATIFTTGEIISSDGVIKNGVIGINFLEIYQSDSKKYNYTIEEIATNNPNYEITNANVKVELEKDKTTTKVIENKRSNINISGYVWEDIPISGKNDLKEYNSLYNENEKDLLISEITVKLIKNGEIISETKTNDKGKYEFKEVSISDLSNCYIEFVYDGLKYTSVELNKEKDNGSKAQENFDSRTIFNEKYEVVYYSFKNDDVSVSATTKDAEIKLDECKIENNEIKNINLGLRSREKTDAAISYKSDIENVEVSVNNYTHTYNYGLREKQNVPANALNMEIDNIDTYVREMYENDVKYSKTLDKDNPNKLKVYVTYKIMVQNETQTLKIAPQELVYYMDKGSKFVDSWIGENKITWKDTSEYGNINCVKGNGYSNEQYDAIYLTEMNDTEMNDIELESSGKEGSALVIYLKVQLSDEKVLSLINDDGTTKENNINNIVEINAYTTYYTEDTFEAGKKVGESRKSQVYGSLDCDSTPGNAKLEDISTYNDDDTYKYPILKLKLKAARGLSGTVWEDTAIKDSLYHQERYGNGILDSNENKVKGAKVELLKVKEDGIYENATLYTSVKNEENKIATTYTDENGKYEFLGVIPDNYVIRFTYGNNEVITTVDGKIINARDYKSTIINSNSIVYKVLKGTISDEQLMKWYLLKESYYSDAVDDVSARETFENVCYDNLNKEYDMMSITPKFSTGIEFTELTSSDVDKDGNLIGSKFIQIQNDIDFGIIERPYTNFKVDKIISYVKVILQDGKVLLEGNPNDKTVTMSYVKTGLKGIVPVEIDTELLQGASLELIYTIKVKNNSEIDYLNSDYYNFAEKPEGESSVKKSVSKLVDYLDNVVDCKVDSQNNSEWKEITVNELKTKYISDDVYNELNKGNYRIFETEKFNDLDYNEEKEITLKVNKLLSATDELSVNNGTEILEYSKYVSKIESDAIPGNYIPRTEPREQDEDSVKLTIAPPTGGIEMTSGISLNLALYIICGLLFVITGLTTMIVIIRKNKKV